MPSRRVFRTVADMVRRLLVLPFALLLVVVVVPSPPAGAGTVPVGVVAVSAGYDSACALRSDETVVCWGANDRGQLGDGTTTGRSMPALVSGLSGATSVSVGWDHACAVLTGGGVRCWGSNASNQVSSPTGDPQVVPWAVPGLTDAITLAAGEGNTCAVRASGKVVCWGINDHGQSGDTHPTPTDPVQVTGISGATSVSAGGSTSCAVLADRTVSCWGRGGFGQLGPSNFGSTEVPVAIPGLDDVKDVQVGAMHVCALRVAGDVWCWGHGEFAELGDGASTTRATPAPVPGLAQVASLSATAFTTCAAGSNGSVWCWGANDGGQAGDGTNFFKPEPVAVAGIDGVRQVALGGRSVCARRTGAGLWCWGTNDAGQLGDGTSTDRPTPVPVSGMAGTAPWPFTSWGAFVDRLFVDMTGGPPSASDRSQFVSSLGAGAMTRGWAGSLLRQRADSTSTVDPAVRLYRAFLGRAPDASGLRFWTGRRRSGSWTLVRMANHFAGSSEFVRTYGALSNRTFVTRIYVDVLGRAADPSGIDYWTRQLDLRRRSRGSVMVGFSESNEYKRNQEINTELAVAYFFHLGRTPTAAETHDWTTRQAAGVAPSDLLDELLDSAGYARRVAGT